MSRGEHVLRFCCVLFLGREGNGAVGVDDGDHLEIDAGAGGGAVQEDGLGVVDCEVPCWRLMRRRWSETQLSVRLVWDRGRVDSAE